MLKFFYFWKVFKKAKFDFSGMFDSLIAENEQG